MPETLPPARHLVLESIKQHGPSTISDLAGLDLKAKLQALRGFYLSDDPYVELGEGEQGPYLVEKNCPFLAVASERPALCSVTVNAISQLLGYQVIRELRPQAGDSRCLLRIKLDQPLPPAPTPG